MVFRWQNKWEIGWVVKSQTPKRVPGQPQVCPGQPQFGAEFANGEHTWAAYWESCDTEGPVFFSHVVAGWTLSPNAAQPRLVWHPVFANAFFRRKMASCRKLSQPSQYTTTLMRTMRTCFRWGWGSRPGSSPLREQGHFRFAKGAFIGNRVVYGKHLKCHQDQGQWRPWSLWPSCIQGRLGGGRHGVSLVTRRVLKPVSKICIC